MSANKRRAHPKLSKLRVIPNMTTPIESDIIDVPDYNNYHPFSSLIPSIEQTTPIQLSPQFTFAPCDTNRSFVYTKRKASDLGKSV